MLPALEGTRESAEGKDDERDGSNGETHAEGMD
jgi:hypothetical protein